ncbi:hypothetical protein ABZ504_49725 [Streptomyces mirabilis]|uniref:hypothetical protein n=1 Tax=Streptomyces mirabilis TaxID=68239 RepID=UPI0033FDA9EC
MIETGRPIPEVAEERVSTPTPSSPPCTTPEPVSWAGCANRRTPALSRLPDGSYLSVIGTVPVRVVEAQITVAYDDCSFTNSYRLVTTPTDARRYPAPALVALYHQRWEHESAYFALRHTITDGRVLRSGDPLGVEQEM